MDVDLRAATTLLRIRDGIYADDLVLAAVARMDLLTVIADQPGTLAELCRRHGIARRPADVVCSLLRALGLLEPGETLRPTPLASACLVRGSPYDLRPYLASGASRSTCLEQVELLRTGRPAEWASGSAGVWPLDPAFGEFLAGAQARSRVTAPALVDVVQDLPVGSVLDLSGSEAFAKELRDRELDVEVTVLESTEILTRELPDGYDLHLLSHVLHCRSEPDVQRVLSACYDALPPGGWIIDHDMHLNADKSGPLPVARYSALLLHATDGQCWSEREVESFLAGAGFAEVRTHRCDPDRSAIVARKPSG